MAATSPPVTPPTLYALRAEVYAESVEKVYKSVHMRMQSGKGIMRPSDRSPINTDVGHSVCYRRTHAFIQALTAAEYIPNRPERDRFQTLVATTAHVIATEVDRIVDEREFCVLVFSMLVLFDMHMILRTCSSALNHLIGELSGYTLETAEDGSVYWVHEHTDEPLPCGVPPGVEISQ